MFRFVLALVLSLTTLVGLNYGLLIERNAVCSTSAYLLTTGEITVDEYVTAEKEFGFDCTAWL